MNKKYLLGILFSMFSLVFVSACNSPSNIKANFNQNEYTLSVEESINFFEEFYISGIDKANVFLESSNSTILEETEENVFTAKNSGWAYVIAKNGQDAVLVVHWKE